MNLYLKCSLLSLMLVVLTCHSVSSKSSHKVYPASSEIKFSIRHFANDATGEFQNFQGTFNFLKDQPEKSQVSFSIEVSSINTSNKTRDRNLREVEYFDAEKHPLMTFQSKAFKPIGGNRYMVTGPLSIKGNTKNISLPVTLESKKTLWATGEESLHFSGSFSLNRTEFGVGESSSFLGDEVKIELSLEFRGAH